MIKFDINSSDIHNTGVFANNNVEQGNDVQILFKYFPNHDVHAATLFCRNMNHSKDANCELYIDNDNNVVARALKPIKAGDELTINYDEGLAKKISGGIFKDTIRYIERTLFYNNRDRESN